MKRWSSKYSVSLHYVLFPIVIYFWYLINKLKPEGYLEITWEIYFLLVIFTIFPLCFYTNATTYKNKILFTLLLINLEIFVCVCFITKNLLIFYISFEAILIPMYLLIGVEAYGIRKIKAAYLLFLYTLLGSFFMLFAIFYIYSITNSLSYVILKLTHFSYKQQIILCACFLTAFAVKIPCIPFHLWLPEAHVESTTVGSIILASLILKIPGYGLIVFVLNWFPFACFFFENAVNTISCLSIAHSSLAAFRQLDLKKIIAYSSIAHMNLIVLGIFSRTALGTLGAIYLMIGHALVSSALFFCIGIIYARNYSKNIQYFGGLAQIMPVYSAFFFIFSISNLSFPGTCNFIGEVIIFMDLIISSFTIVLFSCFTIFFSAIYSIWLYNRICFGTVKTTYIVFYKDLSFNELTVLSIFLILTILLGLSSTFII